MVQYDEILCSMSIEVASEIAILSNWKFKEVIGIHKQLQQLKRKDCYKANDERILLIEKRNESINDILTIMDRISKNQSHKVRIHQEVVTKQLTVIIDFIKTINNDIVKEFLYKKVSEN